MSKNKHHMRWGCLQVCSKSREFYLRDEVDEFGDYRLPSEGSFGDENNLTNQIKYTSGREHEVSARTDRKNDSISKTKSRSSPGRSRVNASSLLMVRERISGFHSGRNKVTIAPMAAQDVNQGQVENAPSMPLEPAELKPSMPRPQQSLKKTESSHSIPSPREIKRIGTLQRLKSAKETIIAAVTDVKELIGHTEEPPTAATLKTPCDSPHNLTSTDPDLSDLGGVSTPVSAPSIGAASPFNRSTATLTHVSASSSQARRATHHRHGKLITPSARDVPGDHAEPFTWNSVDKIQAKSKKVTKRAGVGGFFRGGAPKIVYAAKSANVSGLRTTDQSKMVDTPTPEDKKNFITLANLLRPTIDEVPSETTRVKEMVGFIFLSLYSIKLKKNGGKNPIATVISFLTTYSAGDVKLRTKAVGELAPKLQFYAKNVYQPLLECMAKGTAESWDPIVIFEDIKTNAKVMAGKKPGHLDQRIDWVMDILGKKVLMGGVGLNSYNRHEEVLEKNPDAIEQMLEIITDHRQSGNFAPIFQLFSD